MRTISLLYGAALCSMGTAMAAEQVVKATTLATTAAAGETVQVAVAYSSHHPINPELTGIGLRLHWNSSGLLLQGISSLLPDNLVITGQVEVDDVDFDGDERTDRFVQVAWSDPDHSWPNLPSPTLLFNADFVGGGGYFGDAVINLSASSTAALYRAEFVTPDPIAVSCSGTHLEILSRTFVAGEDVTCTASADIQYGSNSLQQGGSTLTLIAGTTVALSAPLSIGSGAVLRINPAP